MDQYMTYLTAIQRIEIRSNDTFKILEYTLSYTHNVLK